jgi:hypothetical protein
MCSNVNWQVSSSDMLEPFRLNVVTSQKAIILKKIGNAQGKTILEYSSSHSKKKKKYTYNPETNEKRITLETYLTMVNTKSMVMLGNKTATIPKVTYYNHT